MLLRSETAAPAAGATAVTIARSNSPLLRSRNANLFKGAGPEATVSTMSGACSFVEGVAGFDSVLCGELIAAAPSGSTRRAR